MNIRHGLITLAVALGSLPLAAQMQPLTNIEGSKVRILAHKRHYSLLSDPVLTTILQSSHNCNITVRKYCYNNTTNNLLIRRIDMPTQPQTQPSNLGDFGPYTREVGAFYDAFNSIGGEREREIRGALMELGFSSPYFWNWGIRDFALLRNSRNRTGGDNTLTVGYRILYGIAWDAGDPTCPTQGDAQRALNRLFSGRGEQVRMDVLKANGETPEFVAFTGRNPSVNSSARGGDTGGGDARRNRDGAGRPSGHPASLEQDVTHALRDLTTIVTLHNAPEMLPSTVKASGSRALAA